MNSKMQLGIGGKTLVAHAMLHRGQQFLASGLLLRQKYGYPFVVLRLLCQGLEIIIKGILLLHNYNKYISLLRVQKGVDRKMAIGHDLLKGLDYVHSEFSSRQLAGKTRQHLSKVNELYTRHLLRYSSPLDLFPPPEDSSFEIVAKKAYALSRLGEKILGDIKPNE